MYGNFIKIRDDLQQLFEKIPQLINSYEVQVPLFVQAVKHWFEEAEKILKSHQVPQFSELAAMRGCITAAEQGVRDNSFLVENNVRITKSAPAIAIISLKRAQDILHMILDPVNRSLEEAKKLIRGIVIIAAQLEFIDKYSDPEGGLTVSVRELWELLATKDNIREALTRVLTIVSFYDAVILMAECLDELPPYLSKKQLTTGKNVIAAEINSGRVTMN